MTMTPLDELVRACEYYSLEYVCECMATCVAQGVDINDANNARYKTPLIAVCERHQAMMAEYLLQCGADVNVHGQYGWTALHCAIHDTNYEPNMDLVKLLLAHGADVMAVDNGNETALHKAVKRKNFNRALVEMLIDAGADFTAATTAGGFTPLHTACWFGIVESAEFLLHCGVDVDARDTHGHTPLRLAAVQRHIHNPPLVELLLKYGADPNARDNSGQSIVWMHVHDGRVDTEVLRFLLDYGLDLLGANDPDRPLLHRMVASLDSPSDALDLALRCGLEINELNKSGDTALHVVSAHEWELSVTHADILLSRGAQAALTMENTDGYLPLHCAMSRIPTRRPDDNAWFLSLLLMAGADVNATTRDGLSPMSLLLNYFPSIREGRLPSSHDVFHHSVRLLCYYGATWDESCERRLRCMEQLVKTPSSHDDEADATVSDTITVQVKRILARVETPQHTLQMLSGLRSCIQFWAQERTCGGEDVKLTNIPAEVYMQGEESVDAWLKRT